MPSPTVPAPSMSFFLFKESLISFILSRIWQWTAAPGIPRWLLSSTQARPCPPHTIYIYMMNSPTASHHLSSSHTCSLVRPLPSPTQGQPNRCAAFCGVQPSHTHHGSSDLPMSHSHCCYGPLPDTMYTNPLTAPSMFNPTPCSPSE